MGGGETPVTGSHILDIEEEIDFGVPLLNLRGSVRGRIEVSVTTVTIK